MEIVFVFELNKLLKRLAIINETKELGGLNVGHMPLQTSIEGTILLTRVEALKSQAATNIIHRIFLFVFDVNNDKRTKNKNGFVRH